MICKIFCVGNGLEEQIAGYVGGSSEKDAAVVNGEEVARLGFVIL